MMLKLPLHSAVIVTKGVDPSASGHPSCLSKVTGDV